MELLKKRLYSFTLDILFIFIMNRAFMGAYFKLIEDFFPINKAQHAELLSYYPYVQLSLFIILFFGYFIWTQYVFDGKTFGALLNKIKIQNKMGLPPTLREITLRTLGTFICYMSGLVLFIPIAFSKNNLGVSDWMSMTEASPIQEKPLSLFNMNESFEDLDEAA